MSVRRPERQDTPRTRRAEDRPLRVANSIRLPFWVGAAALLLLAVVAAATVGRAGASDAVVPSVVLDYQRGLTVEMAQNVRRGLNEGVEDLTQTAFAIDAAPGQPLSSADDSIQILHDVHQRYAATAVVDRDGDVIAGDAVPSRQALTATRPGIAAVVESKAGRPLIEQFVPLASGGAVVANYDPAFLEFALDSARPGHAWVADNDGRVIASTEAYLPFDQLPTRALRNGGERAAAGASGASAPERGIDGDVVAWAPVAGEGPGGQLDLLVVTRRPVLSLSLPATDARREGLVVAVLISIFTVATFSWLWLVVFLPLLRLRAEAERVAAGQVAEPVVIIRYDEIGLVSRALDRLRILLVGARVPTAARQDAVHWRARSRARQAVVALAVVAGLVAFVALLAFVTTVGLPEPGQVRENGQAPRLPRTAVPCATPATSTTPGPPVPGVQLEPSSCTQMGQPITYRARNDHAAAQVRVTVASRDAAWRTVTTTSGGVQIPAGEERVLEIAVPVDGDLRRCGSACAVTTVRVTG